MPPAMVPPAMVPPAMVPPAMVPPPPPPPPVYPAIEMPFPSMILGAPPPPPLIAGIIPPLVAGAPPPPPPPRPPSSRVLGALDAGTRLSLLQACTSFEHLLAVRLNGPALYATYELNCSSLLTLMTERYFAGLRGIPSTAVLVESAKEVLIYQRYIVQGEISREGQHVLAGLLHDRLVTKDRNNVVMRTADIPQLKENNYFYERFSAFYHDQLVHATYPMYDGDPRHWVMLQDESHLNIAMVPTVVSESPGLQSVEFEVDDVLDMADFYAAWLLTYRFKYESITTFARRPIPIAPADLGKIHFIAFLMDQFYLSQLPFNRKSSARTGPRIADPVVRAQTVKTQVLTGWRNRCFMGVWFPLKIAEEGFFSLDFSKGIWEKVRENRRTTRWAYFQRNDWGIFQEVRGGGHLLYWKMLAHLAETVWRSATVVEREDRSWEEAFLDTKVDFDEDFGVLRTLELAAKYELVDTN
ncbi:hypothetical protein P167DRAFT_577788 [Morchella conica CCBAS932]|uniref:Uncharacterized protein n=1 Tax=Morchella conica CCBAS932 TaxID=1392247 RepID=A0A3N4KEJ8_9PEZI|nr:hypothetical protein P167DRAFT_577788 [Morchella conica CCBAS932]